jgi:hypothetical protein
VLGRVVGVNTSGASRQLQLAIPAAAVNRVLDELGRRGRIPRAYLGVGTQQVRLPEGIRQRSSLDQQTAVIVVDVQPNSPAAGAGLLIGDITAEPTVDDIATYPHGMIQAIYKAYGLGPSCTPYEIAVGDQTKKMASCLPCTFFMVATGYPPSSIHLGRGGSWAPLYAPYNPGGPTEVNEPGVIRDLNNAWYDACGKFLPAGLQILDDDHIAADHRASRDTARTYLTSNKGTTVAATLILDAVSMHESETDRINRTLR